MQLVQIASGAVRQTELFTDRAIFFTVLNNIAPCDLAHGIDNNW